MSHIQNYKKNNATITKWKQKCNPIPTPHVTEGIGYIITCEGKFFVKGFEYSDNLQDAKFIFDLAQSSHDITCDTYHRKIDKKSQLRHAIIRNGKIQIVNITIEP